MANRISRIYTRTGDDGTTGLADGTRVAKDAARMHAIGAVDELNSAVGVVLAEPLPGTARDCLGRIQHDLFDLGGELSLPAHPAIGPDHIRRLEEALDGFNGTLEPLREFILPGGSRAAAQAHVARTLCRRAERALVTLAQSETLSPPLLSYVNRLSDVLFVLARVLNRYSGQSDVYWQHERN
jgi:cob(I)alamin adenosyltransferase